MSDETVKRKSIMIYVHLTIMILIMFCFRLLPPFLAMTPAGMAVLGTFLGWLYGICFCDMCIACLLGFIAISFTGIMPISDYYKAGFGNDTVLLIIFGMFFMGGLIAKFDLTNLLIQKIFQIKFLYKKPWILSGGLLILSYFICIFTNPYIVVLFVYQVIISISKKAGFKPFSMWPSMMIIGSTILASMAIVGMPYQGTVLLFMGIFQEAANGLTISWGAYLIWVNLVSILGIVIYLLVCRFIFRADISALNALEASFFGEASKATKEQKVALSLFVLFVCILLSFGFIPEGWALKSYLNTIGLAGLVMLCIVLASIIRVDGKPLINFIEMATQGIQWNVFLITAFSIPLMTLLTNSETGIMPSLMTVLMPILGGHSPMIFVVVVLIVSVLLTNCLNNMVVIMIMIPILCGYALEMGLNPALLITMLIITGYLAVLLPAGSPLTAIMFSYKEWMSMKIAWIYGGLILVIWILVMLVIGFPLGNLLF